MTPDTHKSGNECRRVDIAAYLDGELTQSVERSVEDHLSECESCRTEIRLQREMLNFLESAMADEAGEPEIPENFANVVTANAESSVSGIRSSAERSKAVFILASLVFVAAVSLGTDAGAMAYFGLEELAVQGFAVASFLFHLIVEAGTGIGVILHSLGHVVIYSSLMTALAAVSLFIVSSLALSRMIVRFNRSS